MFLRDSGHGITEQSLQFWHENKSKIGKVQHLFASFEPLAICDDEIGTLEWNVEIRGVEGTIFLSGCNCGYGGTGPNGTAKILAELGMPIETAGEFVWHKNIHFDPILNIWSAGVNADAYFTKPNHQNKV